MVRQIIKYFPLIIGLFYCCCSSNNKEEKTVEEIIADITQECDSIDFSKFYNLELIVRERKIYGKETVGLSTVMYEPDSLPKEISIPPRWYCSVFSYKIGGMSIRDDELVDKRYKEYISNDSIKSLVRSFLDLKLDYLKVDYKNNVFLSPMYFSFERPFMMRVNDSVIWKNNKHLRFQGKFTRYKENWYIADLYIDKYDIKME